MKLVCYFFGHKWNHQAKVPFGQRGGGRNAALFIFFQGSFQRIIGKQYACSRCGRFSLPELGHPKTYSTQEN